MPQVILIDDDLEHHSFAESLMKTYDFFDDFKCYNDSKAAIIDLVDAHYGEHRLPDIILLEVNMPDLHGWDFLEMFENLKTLLAKDIPVFILSSSIDPEDKIKSEHFSVVKGFYQKPLTAAVVESVVSETRRANFLKRL
ncbi:response regulator [Desertivirga brevis]|uniref:response regulator n=1 Tax=Desertivirga brevis TaxID=2810310 RepID=UPI001A95BFF3|nr:response regulator [Pedobacter sp. SYSU D00873]